MAPKPSETTLTDQLRGIKEDLQDAMTQAETQAADADEADGPFWDVVRDLEGAYDLVHDALLMTPVDD